MCSSNDDETKRHCACGLANVAMYGGAENQEAMIRRNVPIWLFTLAFSDDDTVRYFGCMAIGKILLRRILTFVAILLNEFCNFTSCTGF